MLLLLEGETIRLVVLLLDAAVCFGRAVAVAITDFVAWFAMMMTTILLLLLQLFFLWKFFCSCSCSCSCCWIGLDCCLMLQQFLCNRALLSCVAFKNKEAGQLDVNYLLAVLDCSFKVWSIQYNMVGTVCEVLPVFILVLLLWYVL